MVILIGNKIRLGGLVDVIKHRLGDEVFYINENASIKNQENDILAIKNAKYAIYDIDQYFDDSEELIETIRKIQRTNSATPILYVQTDNPKNEIIKEAVARQIKNFINESRSLGEQKDQFEKIISGFYEANGREDVEAVEKEVIEETKTLKSFMLDLFYAKQREDEKEKTVIINQKRKSEVVIGVISNIIKSILGIISIALMAIAIIAIIYTEPREALIKILSDIYFEVLELVGMRG
ncbi:hypothetical protein ACGCUP_00045 [Eubacteriales bacterium KG125]